ncbi:hypothetical protein QTP88_017193 [Uroleucon formosanum]
MFHKQGPITEPCGTPHETSIPVRSPSPPSTNKDRSLITLKSDTNAVGQSNDRIVLNEIKDLVTVEKIYSSLSNDMFVPVHNNDPINQLPVNRLELRDRIRANPYRPIMESYPKTMQGASERSFQKSWFEKYVWLEYSPSKDLAFCFPCRIFKGNNLNSSQLDDAFSKTGFCSWYRGINRFNKHQITKSHIFSTQAMADYLNTTSIDQQIDISRKEYISKCESDRLRNREIMKRLIDITLCFVKGGKPLRGHDEGEKSNQKGLFKEIVNTFAKYEIVLKEHFENGPKNAKYTSNRIQNDLISSIHNVLIKKVKADLQNVYVSILADETSDVGHHEQFSIVIQYFDDQMNRPVETFLDLVRLVSVNAESIFTAISNIIHSKFGIGWSSIIAVCFDGASTMSGNIGGVQRKFKEINANILYVHCYAHCLNLSLIDSITSNTSNKNQVVFNFLGSVQFLYSFIEGSPTRHAIFENIAKEHGSNLQTLKSCSTTRWACRSKAVNAIKHNYRALLKALDEITKKSLLPDVKMKGLGLKSQIKSLNFIFCMNMMQPILQLVLKVSSSLQTPKLDLLSAVKHIQSLKSSLISMRDSYDEFELIFKNTENVCINHNIIIPPIKNRKISKKIDNATQTRHIFKTKFDEMRVNVYNTTLDTLINGLDLRFKQETLDIINIIGNLVNLDINMENYNTEFDLLNKYFHISKESLISEITLLKQLEDTPKGTCSGSVYKWLDWLNKCDRSNIFNNFFLCLKMFVIIPVTSCGCERSFSKLTIVKSKLRSTMTQDRLNALLFLFVEQELTSSVNIESVIDEFKNLLSIERRLVL